jgi:hypothetical protein
MNLEVLPVTSLSLLTKKKKKERRRFSGMRKLRREMP